MDSAYFKSKNEILSWVKKVLKLNITKVEQACTGAIYCQLLDAIHPGKVKMNKVNWKASLEHEFLANLKILQQALTELNIPNAIDISKLAKGRYQDNFEILQWFYGYFESKCPDLSRYDAEKRRNYAELSYLNTLTCNRRFNNNNTTNNACGAKSRSKSKENLTSEKLVTFIDKVNLSATNKHKFECNSVHKCNSSSSVNNMSYMVSPSTYTKCSAVIKEENIDNNNNINNINNNCINNNDNVNVNEFIQETAETNYNEIENIKKEYEEKITTLTNENEKMKRENKTIKIILADIGKERDFYYSKLRDFEYLLNKPTSCDKELLMKIMIEILQSDKEREVKIDQEGNVTLD
jgi:RP/EB family microtubule-associated protein